MKIKEISEQLGMSPYTLRYYEKVGLMRPVKKNGSGVRTYSSVDVSRLEFIQCMRKADVSIEALKAYISLYDSQDDTLQERKELLQEQYDQMQLKYEALGDGLSYLAKKIRLLEENKLDRSLEEE